MTEALITRRTPTRSTPAHVTLASSLSAGVLRIHHAHGRAGLVGLLPGGLSHGQCQLEEQGQGERLELSGKERDLGQDGCYG